MRETSYLWVKEPWRKSMRGRMRNTKKGAALGFD